MKRIDTHYHLEFLSGEDVRTAFLETCRERKMEVIAQTVLPSSYLLLLQEGKRLSREHEGLMPRMALGFHPWWIHGSEKEKDEEKNENELKLFQEWISTTRYIGEIGLDFSPKRLEQASREQQISVLRTILRAAAQREGSFVLSLHAVQSATALLDELEAVGAPEHGFIPIFHRFSGTSDELTRLVRMGGYLSVHPRMLRSKRGRAYVRQIPADRLLLETDLPPSHGREEGASPEEQGVLAADEVDRLLDETLDLLSDLRREDMRVWIAATQERLFS